MIWVNFKIYRETFGEGACRLAEICRKVSQKTKINIIPVVSPLDLYRIKKEIGGKVWLQHVDCFLEGQRTGWVSPLQASKLGADGVLLNHSEHRLPPGKIRQILKNVGKMETMVCFKSQGQATKWVKKLRPKPDFIAYEPPELIGGEVSVSQVQPQVIKRIVDLLPDYQIIVGAGIKKGTDVKRALKLGAKGVLVSSAVVKAKDPERILNDLLSR